MTVERQPGTSDGFVEGSNGELDWGETWEDPFDLLPRSTRAFWAAGCIRATSSAVMAKPEGPLPFTGKAASKGEIEYAHFAEETPHIVLSKTLDKAALEEHANCSGRR